MKGLLLRSLLAALLIGPVATSIVGIASMRPITEYEPGISEAEMKAYDNRTVAELEAFLQSGRMRLTRYQAIRESMRFPGFWTGLVWQSVQSFVGLFLVCVVVGGIERRHALAAKTNSVS
jgi:hypothetical protein